MSTYTTGPVVGVQATVAVVGNAVAGGTWIHNLIGTTDRSFPDNCHTVIIFNSHAANTLLVGSDLSVIPAGPVLNGVRVPPQGTLTLAIGVLSERVPQVDNIAEVLTSGFAYDSDGAGTVADITYVCGPTI